MRKMSVLSWFWAFIMLLLFGLLLIYAIYFSKNHKYIELERKMINLVKTNDILKEKINSNSTNLINHTDLSEYIKLEVNKDKCYGEVKINKTIFGNQYKPYLKCSKYESFKIFINKKPNNDQTSD